MLVPISHHEEARRADLVETEGTEMNASVEAMPATHANTLAALDAILSPKLFHVAVNQVEMSPDEMRGMLRDIYEIARLAVAKVGR